MESPCKINVKTYRKNTMRYLMFVTIIVSLSACNLSKQEVTNNEILWDTWGVPHIYGRDEESVFKGMGWAQMESHGDLVLRLYGEARGRAAEYWGEQYLDSDRFLHTMGVPGRGEQWLARQTPQMLANLNAFAEGINDYAKEHPERLDDEVEIVLPITASDVLAHVNRVLHIEFIGEGIMRQAEKALSSSTNAVAYTPQLKDSVPGSNAWAIGPSRSASGNAILLSNPHLPWGGLYLFYEQQLVGPGFDAYGSTLVGFPGLSIAFNDYLGWTHTVNTYDGADLFTLELKDNHYQFGEKKRALESRTEKLLVKQADGSFKMEILTVRSSVHGPIVAEKAGRAIALRIAGLDQADPIGQWWEMAKATSLEQFERALSRLQVPMFNILYADIEGHIFYLFNGNVPDRSFGDFATWQAAVDGSDPAALWQSYLSYDQLPRILDPDNGWLQNTNDPPWTSTIPQTLSPNDFPAYMAPNYMPPRAQRSAKILQADESITFKEALAYKHDTHVEMADRVLDELITVAKAYDNPQLKNAISILADWDRTVNADSRGALLFEAWFHCWSAGASIWLAPWSDRSPTSTPSGIADTKAAEACLVSASDDVIAKYTSLDASWGDVHRARRNGHDVPVSGAPGYPLGVFRVAGFNETKDHQRELYFGDTYYSVVEFSKTGVTAQALTAYGNASQPHSTHNGDQLELFSRQAMRSVWRVRSEVEANTESRTTLE